MRDGDTVANTCGAGTFTLPEAPKDDPIIEPRSLRNLDSNLRQCRALSLCHKVKENGFLRQVSENHHGCL
jgi:hypothetical protein